MLLAGYSTFCIPKHTVLDSGLMGAQLSLQKKLQHDAGFHQTAWPAANFPSNLMQHLDVWNVQPKSVFLFPV